MEKAEISSISLRYLSIIRANRNQAFHFDHLPSQSTQLQSQNVSNLTELDTNIQIKSEVIELPDDSISSCDSETNQDNFEGHQDVASQNDSQPSNDFSVTRTQSSVNDADQSMSESQNAEYESNNQLIIDDADQSMNSEYQTESESISNRMSDTNQFNSNDVEQFASESIVIQSMSTEYQTEQYSSSNYDTESSNQMIAHDTDQSMDEIITDQSDHTDCHEDDLIINNSQKINDMTYVILSDESSNDNEDVFAFQRSSSMNIDLSQNILTEDLNPFDVNLSQDVKIEDRSSFNIDSIENLNLGLQIVNQSFDSEPSLDDISFVSQQSSFFGFKIDDNQSENLVFNENQTFQSDDNESFQIENQNSQFEDENLQNSMTINENTLGATDFLQSFSYSINSPMPKRRKAETDDFFPAEPSFIAENSNVSQLFHNMSDNIETRDLFGDNSMSEHVIQSTSNNLKFTLSPLSDLSSSDEYMERDSAQITMMSSKVEILNENTIHEASVSKRVKINTFYQTRRLTQTNAALIASYYKVRQCNWKDVANQLADLMEPSLDYLQIKHDLIPKVTVGSKDDCDKEVLNETFEESLEEIKKSFENPVLICSTPENKEELNALNKAFSEMSFEMNEETNQNIEETRNDIQSYSALTHISNSFFPDDDGEFDITTIFNFDVAKDLMEEVDDNQKQITFASCCDEDKRIDDLLALIRENEYLEESTNKEAMGIVQNRKAAIIGHIENIFKTLLESLIQKNPMVFKFRKIKDWKDCTIQDGVLSQRVTAVAVRSLSFTNKNTERTFTIVTHLLSEIYKMLSRKSSCTKRELYYRDVEFLKNQVSVNKAIEAICTMLNVQAWELGILSSSKGLIAGDLIITTDDDEIINCANITSVPQNPSTIKSLQSNAEYVLVVEKDTVFTRLMQENFMEKMAVKIILITAKGYPDVNTRLLLKKIADELHKPIYIIVDADPYGIEIMCTYKFGSLEMISNSEQLALSNNIEWIGIHPSDIESLDITRIELTAADLKKVDDLLKRPYMNDQHIEKELKHMKTRKLKAEIESIYHYSINYLIHDYIPRKIISIDKPMSQISQQIKKSQGFFDDLL